MYGNSGKWCYGIIIYDYIISNYIKLTLDYINVIFRFLTIF